MEEDFPPRNRTMFDYTKTFDVLVGSGEEQQRFTLHRDIFVPRSQFFGAARSSRWNMDPSITVDLTDEDPQIFTLYLHCIFVGVQNLGEILDGEKYGNLKKPLHELNLVNDYRETIAYFDVRFNFLSELYFFADKIKDFPIANEAIDEIIRMSDRCGIVPWTEKINEVYERTTKGMGLRRLMLDYLIYELKAPEYDKLLPEVLAEYMSTIFTIIAEQPGWTIQDAFGRKVSSWHSSHYHGYKVE